MIPRLLLLAALFNTVGCVASIKEKKLRSAMDEIWNEGNLGLIDEAYEPELAYEIKQFVQDNRALYPDIKIEIDDVIVRGPKMVTTWSVTGTHRDLHKVVTLHGVSVRTWEGGRFVEEKMYYDLKQVYDQLGFRVIPPDGASPFEQVAADRATPAANPCDATPAANPCGATPAANPCGATPAANPCAPE